jgi:hypothetical protein
MHVIHCTVFAFIVKMIILLKICIQNTKVIKDKRLMNCSRLREDQETRKLRETQSGVFSFSFAIRDVNETIDEK